MGISFTFYFNEGIWTSTWKVYSQPAFIIILCFLLFFFFKQKTAYEISACLVGSEMCIRDRSTWVSLLPSISTRVFGRQHGRSIHNLLSLSSCVSCFIALQINANFATFVDFELTLFIFVALLAISICLIDMVQTYDPFNRPDSLIEMQGKTGDSNHKETIIFTAA
eukprot:TRINITY_DN16589_c0_g1_i1.p1 TRINITY_DN16589_c0_g1~~TRINITY_DN16589_c0_g1_i1.p1  ORF type:complete len:166 (-),score=26.63 TRINITY_DN16589_c0_g1_i1:59-556(-)